MSRHPPPSQRLSPNPSMSTIIEQIPIVRFLYSVMVFKNGPVIRSDTACTATHGMVPMGSKTNAFLTKKAPFLGVFLGHFWGVFGGFGGVVFWGVRGCLLGVKNGGKFRRFLTKKLINPKSIWGCLGPFNFWVVQNGEKSALWSPILAFFRDAPPSHNFFWCSASRRA